MKNNANRFYFHTWYSLFCYLLFLIFTNNSFATCNIEPQNVVVTTNNVPLSTWFVTPIGDNLINDLNRLTIGSFNTFNYPKIRFNDDNDNVADTNEWFVATAFNNNRWLNNGWNTEPSNNDNSYYCSSGTCSSTNWAYHPGEDWNATLGNNTWPSGDAGAPIHPIADGVVLFNGWAYGNTLIILHKVPRDVSRYEYITSFYGHMQNPSTFSKGARVSTTDVIGYIGNSGTVPYHLHFEIRRGPIESGDSIFQKGLVKIDTATREVCLTDNPGMWPATGKQVNNDKGKAFIENNYYHPSYYLLAPPCHLYTNGDPNPVPAGYGAAYNPFSSGKEDLLKVFCGRIENYAKLEIGNGSTDVQIYSQAYISKNGATWIPITLEGGNKNGDWFIGTATKKLDLTATELSSYNYIAAYVCIRNGASWACGCSDATCTGSTANMWNGQAFRRYKPSTSTYSLTVTTAGTGFGTVTSNPAGITCGIDCNESFVSETVVTLTANPGSGSSFAGWGGACTGTATTCTVTMTATKAVTATFSTANVPSALAQYRSNGVTAITVGSTTPQTTVVLKGKVSDPAGRTVKLQVELRRLNEYNGSFTRTATQESALVASGSTVSIPVYGLINGNYHWQARTVNSANGASAWVPFGGNSDSATDFVVAGVGYASVSQGLNVSPTPVKRGQNFTISFTLKERNGVNKTFENVAIAILNPSGTWIFDFVMYNSVTIPANGTKSFTAQNYIYTSQPLGTYKAVARGKEVGGNWLDFDTVDSGVNPRSFSVVQ